MGQIYNLKCPADLKFNPDSMKCDLTDNIPLCQNEISTDQSTQTAASPIDCSSLPDGTYGNGQCSEYYIACHQGRMASMRCPSNLYYNQVSKQCDFKKNVKECITEENTPSNGLPGMDVQMPVQHQTQQSQLPQQTHTQSDSFPSFSCLNKADGVYSPQDQGCVDFFWMCTNSRTFKSACPRGLYYNRNTKQCDHKSSIAECNQFQPITAFVSNNILNPYQNKGVAYEQSCPNGLVYNRMMGLCDHYDNCIRAVNPNTPMPSQIAPVAAEGFPPLEPGPVIIQQPISTTPAKEMDCTNKPDGFYSIGCSANYYACAGGSMSTFTCPANLKYDSVMKVCNYAENVPACRAAEPAKVP
ncbi:unnamed protein product [Anisakis simplex]|uniref:Chitin-binding type-2 domain-containing protein n=1 Tax=Anisakis simplex TaxID=6269 RepID=A0A3P6RUU7_ANISI|nr:unnamed protein product [Anisakis simplex]